MGTFRIKRFSAGSKALWAFAPGGYQAKEAGKFAYGSDSDDYEDHKWGLALKGAFTPIVATAVNQKAKKMAEQGYSKEEIRDFIEGRGDYRKLRSGRRAAGIAEVLTGSAEGIGPVVAGTVGLVNKVSGERAEDFERRKKRKR